MISNFFNSNQNKNAIKTIISEDFYKEQKINIGNNHDIIISETMQFVESQVSKTPPRGMDNNEYLYLMNKKVYDIAYPVIKELVQTNAKGLGQEKSKVQKVDRKTVNNQQQQNINNDKKKTDK